MIFSVSNLTTIFTQSLPSDPETQNFTRQVPNTCYSLYEHNICIGLLLGDW